ncbi:hypothetical protein H696_04027 [Fonticula alba]|uniref:Uncharacterized protein n=1 Tax=Fonticula alba TaxID=691883 RepID=A0A058Z6Q9_FONAL|nr:hypothetical protein H696_04027 [Fonticula alba]KCV69608.1 hypothetical protein H696_04027 [Fonticula alba]|eukprot:XP_009496173.1 hypothetical protein H696_04027 [Fonticula alba]
MAVAAVVEPHTLPRPERQDHRDRYLEGVYNPIKVLNVRTMLYYPDSKMNAEQKRVPRARFKKAIVLVDNPFPFPLEMASYQKSMLSEEIDRLYRSRLSNDGSEKK